MIKKRHFLLNRDTMSDDLIGFSVTIGIGAMDGSSTKQAVIERYDDEHLFLKIGTKTKKFPYDPHGIVLCVYQFEKGIHFVSNIEMDEYEGEKSQNNKTENGEIHNA